MSRRLLRPVARLAREMRAHAAGAAAYAAGTPRDEVRVSYALRIPAADEQAVGGIVKLQHLAAAFPDQPRRFNLLYLVSSRLPDGAVALAAWAHRKGARVVLNQNGVAYPAWYGPGWERENRPMTALLARADYVLYQSRFCKHSADRFAGPAGGSLEVLHNAVDTERFAPAPHAMARPLTLLLAGSQDQRYRFESAVRTVALLVRGGLDARLIVTGRLRWDGNPAAARRDATALVDSLGLQSRVDFIGPYTQVDAPAIFRRADILIHTKYNDPCPTVVLEAMASGCPVVYSASGGVPELVGTEAGIGVPAPEQWDVDVPPPPDALADAIHRVRPDLRRWAEAARARAVARFDIRQWLARHRDIFAALVTS